VEGEQHLEEIKKEERIRREEGETAEEEMKHLRDVQ
jgi:hypothetical protein